MVTCDTNLSSESSGALTCANGTFVYSITPTANVSSNAIEMWIFINGQQVTDTGKWIFNLNEPVTFDNKLKVTVTSLFGTIVKFDVCCVDEKPIPCTDCQSGCSGNDYITKTCDETTGTCNETISTNDTRCLPAPILGYDCDDCYTKVENGQYPDTQSCLEACVISPIDNKYSCSDDCTSPIHATGYSDKLTCLDSCISATPITCLHTIDVHLQARNPDNYTSSLDFAQAVDNIIRLSDTPIKLQNSISDLIADVSTSIEVKYIKDGENKNAVIRICISSTSQTNISVLPVIAGVAGEAIIGIILITLSVLLLIVGTIRLVTFDGDNIKTNVIESDTGANVISNDAKDVTKDSDDQTPKNTDSTPTSSSTGAPVELKTTKECGTHDGVSYNCHDSNIECPSDPKVEHIPCVDCFSIFEAETINKIGCGFDIPSTTEDTNKEKEIQDDTKNEIENCKTDNSCTDIKMYGSMIKLQGSFTKEAESYRKRGIITQVEYNTISGKISSLLTCIGDKNNAIKSNLTSCQLNITYGSNVIETELDNKFVVFTNLIKENTVNLIDDMNALLPMYESSELGDATTINNIKSEITILENAISTYETLVNPTTSDAIEFNRAAVLGAKAIEYYTNKIAIDEKKEAELTTEDSCEKLTGISCSTFKTTGLAIGGLIGLKLLSDIFGKK